MIQELILAILSAAGFVLSWNMTNLKAHVLGLFFPSLRNKTVDEVELELDAGWGTLGELLNCPYCLSAWTGLSLFGLFTWAGPTTAMFVSAFLIPAALIHALQPYSHPVAAEESKQTDEEPVEAEEEPDYEFSAPADIHKRILAIRDNPVKHSEFVKKNSFLLMLLQRPGSCPNEECKKVVEDYKKELKQMTAAHEANPGRCPSCVRGNVVNKYLFMLHDLLGDQEVSLLNPQTPFTPNDDTQKETTTKDTAEG